MGFEEARTRLMLRARGGSRHFGVRVKAPNAVTEPRGGLSVGVSGGRANTRPTRRSQGLGGGAVRERSANKRARLGLGGMAWFRAGLHVAVWRVREERISFALGAGLASLGLSPLQPGRPAAPDSGPDLLPRYSAGPRLPGADPAGAAHAPRDLLLRDHARSAPPGAALLLS